MTTATHILVCHTDETYTILNRYDGKTHAFEGEYSLLHNTYTNDAYFLSRFLMQHRSHHLTFVTSDDEDYYNIKHRYAHFEENDIDKYVQELAERRAEAEHELSVKQNVGQIQILVAKKMIEQEWDTVRTRDSTSERDTYVLLGQDYAFRWSVQTINNVVGFGNGRS